MKQKLDRFLRAHPPIRFAADMADVYFSKRVSRAAAELAYFLILTFFPIMICMAVDFPSFHFCMLLASCTRNFLHTMKMINKISF